MEPSSNLSVAYLDLLPNETLQKILLETDDLKTLSKWCQTSKRINIICQDEKFWKQKFRKDFGFSSHGSWGLSGETTLMKGETWRGRYKQQATFKVFNSPISSGGDYYGVIDENGRLYMAGSNYFGQLGNGTITRADNPIPKAIPFKSKVISISCDAFYAGAVTEDGTAYLWGHLSDLGKGVEAYASQAKQKLSGPFGGGAPVHVSPVRQKLPGKALKISCGSGDLGGIISTVFAVILEDRSVYFSGYFTDIGQNISGKLSIQARDIYTGHDFVALISLDDRLYYWGNLPATHWDGSWEDSPRPYLAPFQMPIKQAAFGEYHQILLSTKGEVYTLGSNGDGQLGRPLPEDEDMAYELLELSKLDLPEPIAFISTDRSSTAAISESGRLFVWGSGTIIAPKNPDYDQREDVVPPTEVDIGSPVNYVDIDDGTFLAVTQDGVVNVSENFKPPE